MFASERLRPGSAVYSNGVVGFLSETCSSSMHWTERKATIGAAELLRLQRLKGYVDIDSITTFVFPNMQHAACLTEITVTWKNFCFVNKLTRHADMASGLARLQAVVNAQCNSIFNHTPCSPSPCNALIRLSREERIQLSMDSGAQSQSDADPVQLMSCTTHVMTEYNNIISKVVYSGIEYSTLLLLPKVVRDNHDHDRLIIPQLNYSKYRNLGIYVFKYPKVTYSPLLRQEARQCLGQLVTEIKKCIDQLHSAGLSHNDVHLGNVCFNDDYKPVLIDMERVKGLSRLHPLFSSGSVKSCMYSLPTPRQNFVFGRSDYFQLGWLVAWVLDDSSTNYHLWTWEEQNPAIKSNSFVSALIQNGIYNDALIPKPWFDIPIQTVLEDRERKVWRDTTPKLKL